MDFKTPIIIILKDLKKNMNTMREERERYKKNLSVTFKGWKTQYLWMDSTEDVLVSKQNISQLESTAIETVQTEV